MSSLEIDKRIAFEASYTAATTPIPASPRGLAEEDVHQQLMSSSDSRATRQIEIWAQNNDIQALQYVLMSPWALKRDHSDIERPELTYAVAHMLVDGSDNRSFAHKWINKFGHTTELARKHLADLWLDTSDDRLLDQSRLGLATVASVFKILGHDDETVAPLLQIMGFRDDNNGMSEKQAEGLAHLLRVTSTDSAPKIDFMEKSGHVVKHPLADVLLTFQTLKVRHMLTAIELAYGEDREDIRSMMRTGIDRMLAQDRLPIEPRPGDSPLWDAMTTWGAQGLGRTLWHSTSLPKVPFVQNLFQQCSDEVIIKRLTQVTSLGADLQDPVRLKDAKEDETVRILDIASAYARPEIVGWLLGKNCDPTLESFDPKSGKSVSAKILANAKLQATARDHAEYPAAARVSELISAHLARKSALEAIGDIEMSVGLKP